ncbi:MAG TPA: 4-(cytidine 5'-diphospho)-2-C-methyl-D-erythritol kinase [Lachnospiraceae bacterium]|nr:4-(cytidine 5'-diphospho)-2-C-methyl-D-erythritol kinase [Lachnospiraceae bacterium]
MILKAMAKINLGLDVIRRREDGYHDLRMIMQSIYLYDQIEMEKTQEPGIHFCTNRSYLPTDNSNLAVKAAKLLMDEFQIREGVKIDLAKNIPVAAGLAGGSTDAAAVLVGLNQMFDLRISEKELMRRGASIGADIPYCIMRGTALAEGIGDKLTRLDAMPMCHILIARPGVSVSTRFVYSNLHLEEVDHHPDIDGMIEAIGRGSLSGITDRLENVLESVTINKYPIIRQLKEKMISCGAMGALMSGSGPTVFGIFKDKQEAAFAADQIRKEKLARNVFVTRPFQINRK